MLVASNISQLRKLLTLNTKSIYFFIKIIDNNRQVNYPLGGHFD